MGWTTIPSSTYAVGKPITSTWAGYLKGNDDYLKALFDASTGHGHTGGGDDAPQIDSGGIANGAVKTANLGLSSGSYTGAISSGASLTVALNRYAHIRQSYYNQNDETVFYAPRAGQSSFQNGISISQTTGGGGGYVGTNWDYHTT